MAKSPYFLCSSWLMWRCGARCRCEPLFEEPSPLQQQGRRRKKNSSNGDSCSWVINKVSVRGGFRRGQEEKKQHRLFLRKRCRSVCLSYLVFVFFLSRGDLWRDNYKSVGSCSLVAALLCFGVTSWSCFEIYPAYLPLYSSQGLSYPALSCPALPTLRLVPKPKYVGSSLGYLHSSPGVHSYLQYQYIYIVVIWRGQASITATTNSAVWVRAAGEPLISMVYGAAPRPGNNTRLLSSFS